MGCQWNPIGFQLYFFLFLFFTSQSHSSLSFNSDGLILLKFRARIDSDPQGTLANWNVSDHFCSWFGVTCVDNKVQMLNLSGCSLGGTLAPELSQLNDLKSLILYNNNLFGEIPKEFGKFAKLELLDLRKNKLSGVIPPDLYKLLSPENVLLSSNKFAGFMKLKIKILRFKSLYKAQLEKNRPLLSAFDNVIGCINRKLGYCVSRRSLISLKRAEAFMLGIRATSRVYMPVKEPHENNYIANFPSSFKNGASIVKRRELLQATTNLPAMVAPNGSTLSPESITELFSRSSGSFPATKRLPPPSTHVKNNNTNSNDSLPKSEGLKNVWLFVIISTTFLLVILVIIAAIFLCRKKAVQSITPWKTGLSGQLQKAFVTGVPNLNRSELDVACEDFSNIIEVFNDYTVYKGTLSSGVEIAVASTSAKETKEWTRAMEMSYRKKINTITRINHKNFVNLIGYCEENDPFNRMMVFEYAPNGTLFEHLHDKEMEHLDWNVRVRIIMGIAYCLQYMHELNPPVVHSNLVSSRIYLTDDYAAKVVETPFSARSKFKPRKSISGDFDHSSIPSPLEPETNVYNFGVLLLEVISGKLSDATGEGSIVKWASKYLENDRLKDLIDPTLTTFNEKELEVICEVIRNCLKLEESQRPNMKEVVDQLKEVIKISEAQATPRLSPLWWAELEILSSEAS